MAPPVCSRLKATFTAFFKLIKFAVVLLHTVMAVSDSQCLGASGFSVLCEKEYYATVKGFLRFSGFCETPPALSVFANRELFCRKLQISGTNKSFLPTLCLKGGGNHVLKHPLKDPPSSKNDEADCSISKSESSRSTASGSERGKRGRKPLINRSLEMPKDSEINTDEWTDVCERGDSDDGTIDLGGQSISDINMKSEEIRESISSTLRKKNRISPSCSKRQNSKAAPRRWAHTLLHSSQCSVYCIFSYCRPGSARSDARPAQLLSVPPARRPLRVTPLKVAAAAADAPLGSPSTPARTAGTEAAAAAASPSTPLAGGASSSARRVS